MSEAPTLPRRPLGRTGLLVTPIGFGAFKIGRSAGAKYPWPYDLPSDAEAVEVLRGVVDLGIGLIDTAPAYGLSESRIGATLHAQRGMFVLSTKAGEQFEQGRSRFDFSETGVRRSIERSVERLEGPPDLLFVHSDGRDLEILRDGGAVRAVLAAREAGLARAVGFSGKTPEGARAAMDWADVLMVAYNARDRSHEGVIDEARERGLGVLVKKGLASGHLPAGDAVRFCLANPGVDCLVVGGLDLDHLAANVRAALEVPSIRARSVPTDA